MTTPLRPLFIGLLLLVGVSEATRIWWYSSQAPAPTQESIIAWSAPPHAVNRNLAQTRGGQILGYDAGVQVLLQESETSTATEVIYLEYERGNDRMLLDLHLHSPEVCFPASGIKLVRELPSHSYPIGSNDFVVRHWLFTHPITEAPLHAFKLIWSNDVTFRADTLYRHDFKAIRLRSALDRREFSAARMLLATTTGAENEKDAWAIFQRDVLAHLTTP